MSDSNYCNKRNRIKNPRWNDDLSVFLIICVVLTSYGEDANCVGFFVFS